VVLVKDLNHFKADLVVARGQVIAENGKLKISLPKFKYPAWATNSVHLKRKLKADDFRLHVKGQTRRPEPVEGSQVKVNVIGVIENQAPTRHLTFDVQPENGEIKADMGRDIAKIALVERHKGTGRIMLGLVSGFGFDTSCAIASTVAHDSHHMLVVGTDETSMAAAANSLAKSGGGQVVVKNGRVIGQVDLKIAGLMSHEKADVVAKKAGTILKGFQDCGCKLNNPNMQLSLLALVVIPELRISDKGLVDVTKFKFVPVVEG